MTAQLRCRVSASKDGCSLAFEAGGNRIQNASDELGQLERGTWGVPGDLYFEVPVAAAGLLPNPPWASGGGAQVDDQVLGIVLSEDGPPALVLLLSSAVVTGNGVGERSRPTKA
jgi:hypothetical protein